MNFKKLVAGIIITFIGIILDFSTSSHHLVLDVFGILATLVGIAIIIKGVIEETKDNPEKNPRSNFQNKLL